ncbi:unnamed protein product [Clavelina lepadiformis]|uniref:Uncharacterized protein n=1 Tax=Clavelina lepadiformis TaxID=159417 RepID=A0ABP0G2K1_CLALP
MKSLKYSNPDRRGGWQMIEHSKTIGSGTTSEQAYKSHKKKCTNTSAMLSSGIHLSHKVSIRPSSRVGPTNWQSSEILRP